MNVLNIWCKARTPGHGLGAKLTARSVLHPGGWGQLVLGWGGPAEPPGAGEGEAIGEGVIYCGLLLSGLKRALTLFLTFRMGEDPIQGPFQIVILTHRKDKHVAVTDAHLGSGQPHQPECPIRLRPPYRGKLTSLGALGRHGWAYDLMNTFC